MQEVQNVRNMENRGIIRRDYKQRFYLSGQKFHSDLRNMFYRRNIVSSVDFQENTGHMYGAFWWRFEGFTMLGVQFLSLFVVADDDHSDYLLDHFIKSHDFSLIEPFTELQNFFVSSKIVKIVVKIWNFHREKVLVQLHRMIKIC